MAIVQLTIPGDPIVKGRPRSGKGGHTYTPKRTKDAEEVVGTFCRQAMGVRAPVTVRVGIAAEFFCATMRRCDGDNLMKLVSDAMNGIVFVDDFQVEEWFCRVHRGVGAADARTEVMVWELE